MKDTIGRRALLARYARTALGSAIAAELLGA
jgi:hypothetical protein